jgi:hypothetical protein
MYNHVKHFVCIQGLDYIAAEGTKAFDDLCYTLRRLQDCGVLSRDDSENLQSTLKSGEHYLKSDYKII